MWNMQSYFFSYFFVPKIYGRNGVGPQCNVDGAAHTHKFEAHLRNDCVWHKILINQSTSWRHSSKKRREKPLFRSPFELFTIFFSLPSSIHRYFYFICCTRTHTHTRHRHTRDANETAINSKLMQISVVFALSHIGYRSNLETIQININIRKSA